MNAAAHVMALAARLDALDLPGAVYVAAGDEQTAHARRVYAVGNVDAIVLYTDLVSGGVTIGRFTESEQLAMYIDRAIAMAAVDAGSCAIDATETAA